MKWTVVQRRIREIWEKKKIAKLMPKRTTAPGYKFKYEDERVFEAMCKMVWDDHPMRNRLPGPYPSPNPLYLRIAAMVRSRALDAVWTAYLEKAGREELKAWQEAFGRIQANRRAPKAKMRSKKRGAARKSKPERTGLSPGLAWLEILLRGLEDACPKKGIDMGRFSGREQGWIRRGLCADPEGGAGRRPRGRKNA